MLQGHLIVWNNVPGGQNDYFEQKGPQTDIHCSKYSLNIAQDPTYPSIWKYLSRNIFDHQRNSFLSNVPGGQNGKVYQCDSLVTLGKLDIKIHQDQSHRSHHCCHRPAHRVLQHKLLVCSWLSRIPSLVPRLHHIKDIGNVKYYSYFAALTEAHDVKCATFIGSQAPTFCLFHSALPHSVTKVGLNPKMSQV